MDPSERELDPAPPGVPLPLPLRCICAAAQSVLGRTCGAPGVADAWSLDLNLDHTVCASSRRARSQRS